MFFDDSRPDRRKRAARLAGPLARAELMASPIPPAKPYRVLSPEELYGMGKADPVTDTECYVNYWLAAFKFPNDGVIYFEQYAPPGGYLQPFYSINGETVTFQRWQQVLGFCLQRFLTVAFNSLSYDLPMFVAALQGLPCWKLKEISNAIIQTEMSTWQIQQKYGLRASRGWDHIDLIEVAPISASLKIYGGRLHCERMQDLPYPEDTELTVGQAFNVRDYCVNDLDVTKLLYDELKPQIALRVQLGEEYGVDLRSKSDAQVAEAIIGVELDRLGIKPGKPTFQPGDTFKFNTPDWMTFKTPVLQNALKVIQDATFVIGPSGHADVPDEIKKLKIPFGQNVYKSGNGGLHSTEKKVGHVASANRILIDRDVASYYPWIIINNNLFPQHLGEAFITVYRDKLVLRRLKLKKEKNKLEAGLKIAINGTFGKLMSIFSDILYAPDLGIHVTLIGQFGLLMFIEAVELAGFTVLSANTDGVVIDCPPERYHELETVVMTWEAVTGFETEEARYKSIYSRDVNSYIALKYKSERDKAGNVIWLDELDGKPDARFFDEQLGSKTKGNYCERGSALNSVLSKNPEALILSDALQAFLAHGTPVVETITNCRDIRRFVVIRNVKGGAEKDGVYLGKAVRWYYAQEVEGTINYVLSGNKVANTEGAKPHMIMTPSFPNDLDFDWYINAATEELYELGYYRKPEKAKLF